MVQPVKASTIFSDGFEEGDFSAWNTTGSGTTVSTGTTHHGTYKAVLIGGSYMAGYVDKIFTLTAEVYFRFYFRTSVVPDTNAEELSLAEIGRNGAWLAIRLSIYNDGADNVWKLSYRDNSNTVVVYSAQQKNPSLNTWYCVEMRAKSGSGSTAAYQAWIEGSELTDVAQTGKTQTYTLDLAVLSSYVYTSPVATVLYDCAVVSDAYIGVESGVTNHWQMTFTHKDLDNNIIDSKITWKLYNSSQLLTYTEGQFTLLDGTYTLKSYYHGYLMNQTSLSTTTYGNTTISIHMNMKLHSTVTQYGEWNYSYEVTASSGSAANIQTAVDDVAAHGGGTVYVPAGTWTWINPSTTTNNPLSTPTVIHIPAGVNVIGTGLAGCYGHGDNWADYTAQTIIVLQSPLPPNAPTLFFIDDNIKVGAGKTRISGIEFHAPAPASAETEANSYAGLIFYSCKSYRLDHCSFINFSGTAVFCDASSGSLGHWAYGVIDHCVVDNPYKNAGSGWLWGYGFYSRGNMKPVYNNWDTNFLNYLGQFGATAACSIMYVEDCHLSRCRHATDGIQGSWNAIRFCKVDNPYPPWGLICLHGSSDYYGGRGMEAYNNTLVGIPSTGWGESEGVRLRGGAGFFYYNSFTVSPQDLTAYGTELCDFDWSVDYPATNIHNTYVWNNTVSGASLFIANQGTINVDYFLRAPTLVNDGFSYTPYTYPHPLAVDQGYIAFNNTITSIVVNSQTYYNLTVSVSGSSPNWIVADVPQNCSVILRNDVEQTGWIYNSTDNFIQLNASSLSVWEFLFEAYYEPVIGNFSIGQFGAETTVYANKYTFLNATIFNANGTIQFVNASLEVSGNIIFKWNNATNVFSEYSDTSNFCILDAGGSSRTVLNSTAYKLSFKVKFFWNYTEGSTYILGKVYIITDVNASGSLANAFTFEDDLIISSDTETNKDNIVISEPFSIDGKVYYEDTSTVPEDITGITVYAELDGAIQGTDTSVTSGTFSLPITAPATIGTYIYVIYAHTDQNSVENQSITVVVYRVLTVGGPLNYTWNPFDLMNIYLKNKNFVGFLVAIYTSIMGELFYGMLILIITIPLYLRTQSLIYCAIVWLVLGSFFAAILPVSASHIAYFFIAISLTSILYKLLTREKD